MRRVTLKRRDGTIKTYLWVHVLALRAWGRVTGAARVLRGSHVAVVRERGYGR